MAPEIEDKLIVWPYWPTKFRTSSSQAEGAEREFQAATLGLDPVVRVLMGVRRAVEGRAALPPRLVEDWRVFN